MQLDHRSETPLYRQLADVLTEHIRRGRWSEGDRIPSERALAETLGISRMTARQAVRILAEGGLIAPRVGKGSYVSQPRIDQRLRMSSFTEEMAKLGFTADSVVLQHAIVPADAELAEMLRAESGEPLAVLERIRRADGVPIAVETSWLRCALCPGLLDGRDFAHASLYDVLRRDYGIVPWRAEQTIAAGRPDRRTRDALRIGRSAPVLCLTRTTFDERGRPIEFVVSTYRGDRYTLRAELSPATSEAP